MRVRLDVLRRQRCLRRRNVAHTVREDRKRVAVGRQVLDQCPRLVLVLHALRDADDRAVHVTGPIELGMGIVDRRRRRAVVERRMLTSDERHPPLTVDHHRELADLESVRRGEFVRRSRVELLELLIAVPVDEALLPFQHPVPGRIPREHRLAASVHVLGAEERRVGTQVGSIACVETEEGVVPGDLDRAVRVLLRQLLRVRGELRHRLRRAGEPGRLEHLLVVVEAVDVGEQRQGTALALVLRVVLRRLREHVDVDLVLRQERFQVDPRTRVAVAADVRGCERAHDVRHLAAADRGGDLVVVDAADDLDGHFWMLVVVFRHYALEGLELRSAPAHPDRDVLGLRRSRTGVGRGPRGCRDDGGSEHKRHEQPDPHASHTLPPLG
jgi:hypothetical protein